MPPSNPSTSTGQRGRSSSKKTRPARLSAQADDPFDSAQENSQPDEEEEPENSIPADLLTRILHEFFEKAGTRITSDANKAVGKYMDTFVREAIARAADEREGAFLEVS
jgi:centromere protein X